MKSLFCKWLVLLAVLPFGPAEARAELAAKHRSSLLRLGVPVLVPTWLPAGFRLERVETQTGATPGFVLVYRCQCPNGQRMLSVGGYTEQGDGGLPPGYGLRRFATRRFGTVRLYQWHSPMPGESHPPQLAELSLTNSRLIYTLSNREPSGPATQPLSEAEFRQLLIGLRGLD